MADRALGGGLVALIDVTADRANVLFHDNLFLPVMF
jgi:hypothetical protein